MSRARFPWFVCTVVVVAWAASRGLSPLTAADAPAAKPPVETKIRGRVPPYYAKLDLTADQKTRIYAIQDQYDDRIDDLLTQIEELRVQRENEIESVLSAGQRTELKKLLDEAKADRAEKRRETEQAKKAFEQKKLLDAAKKAAGKPE